MTTVGYGDKAPLTVCGRALAVAWMFVGLVMFGIFSAVMHSALNDSPVHYNLHGFREELLHSSPLCAVEGQHEEQIRRFPMVHAATTFKHNISECYRMLASDEVRP